MTKGDALKRNITDTETPVLEEVALEEKLKNMKLDLEDTDNGIRVAELPVILENSDVNVVPYPQFKQLPQDRSMPLVISFIFILFVSVILFNHRRKIIAFILEGGQRRRSQRYTRVSHT
ncbi:unnamed protein product [Oikopleura dioica]|uniref:Uncharacterized protein n=1 Tax=Oikopleura dioica TaxID=34765 RepID=E4XW45_OIKDI|nr:unnamed protein product [Oikopleura dioica]